MVYLDYMKKIQENVYVEWDVKTVTAGDYTIEFDIEPSFFDDFLVKKYLSFISYQSDQGKEDYTARVEVFRDWF